MGYLFIYIQYIQRLAKQVVIGYLPFGDIDERVSPIMRTTVMRMSMMMW